MRHDRIILSAKVSGVRDLVDVYRLLAARKRLPAPPRADRGGDGRQGHRRLDGRAGDPAQRGDRRHDPGLAHAGARRAARARGRDRPAGPPVDGAALVPAPGLGLPGLRPDDLDLLPGDGPADPGLPQGADAGLARDAPGAEDLRVAVMGCVVNGPGERSTPTSGSACRARSRSRSPRCSSTAASIARCVATASSPSSSTSSRTTSPSATRRRSPALTAERRRGQTRRPRVGRRRADPSAKRALYSGRIRGRSSGHDRPISSSTKHDGVARAARRGASAIRNPPASTSDDIGPERDRETAGSRHAGRSPRRTRRAAQERVRRRPATPDHRRATVDGAYGISRRASIRLKIDAHEADQDDLLEELELDDHARRSSAAPGRWRRPSTHGADGASASTSERMVCRRQAVEDQPACQQARARPTASATTTMTHGAAAMASRPGRVLRDAEDARLDEIGRVELRRRGSTTPAAA